MRRVSVRASGMLAIALSLAARGAEGIVREVRFEGKDSLAGWTIAGDVSVDMSKSRGGAGGSLRVGPGARALLPLRDEDASGAVDVWVYDDGARPENAKASRVGPRWGLLQRDGKVLAAGILYAPYLGGDEGYTATVCDGTRWFESLFWLGVNRAPARWHKWTLAFDADEGIRILHDGKELGVQIDAAKAGIEGFSAFAVWGDDGTDGGQTIWLADLAVALGGPMALAPIVEADPYDAKAVAAELAARHPAVVYTKDNAPATPALEDLPLVPRVSQHGITWTFEAPARAGRFVNGDWYVVGPATIAAIDPAPRYGADIPRRELDRIDKERPESQRVRNGFMLNPPARMEVAYDSGVRNWFEPALIRKLPVAMRPGDALVATISMPRGLVLKAQLRNKIERGVDDSSPIRTAAVLTCVRAPLPPDAFRPAFCDRGQEIYLARDLRRERLPTAAAAHAPDVDLYVRFTQRPWVGTGFFGFEEPVENMPQYGLEYGRVAGLCALALCTDLSPERKEPLLVNSVQIGIDLGGMVRAGHPGWTGWGGHGSGRKLPIVFAGLLLGDEELAAITKSFPKTSFGEDEQTAYGECWTGATVVFTGHSGIDAATGAGRDRGNSWGPYEHTPPAEWRDGPQTSEAYRRCCTSVGWVAQALALRLMRAESAWGHDAFLDYADRWMHEDDAAFVTRIKEATGKDHDKPWARQGQTWDEFVNAMWAAHRAALGAPADGWKRKHDESYYRAAIERRG